MGGKSSSERRGEAGKGSPAAVTSEKGGPVARPNRNKRPRVLVVIHPDGFVEVFGSKRHLKVKVVSLEAGEDAMTGVDRMAPKHAELHLPGYCVAEGFPRYEVRPRLLSAAERHRVAVRHTGKVKCERRDGIECGSVEETYRASVAEVIGANPQA